MRLNEYIEQISNIEHERRALVKSLALIDDQIRAVKCKRALFDMLEEYKRREIDKETHINIFPGHPVWCGLRHLFPDLPYNEEAYLKVDGVNIKISAHELDLWINSDFDKEAVRFYRELEYDS